MPIHGSHKVSDTTIKTKKLASLVGLTLTRHLGAEFSLQSLVQKQEIVRNIYFCSFKYGILPVVTFNEYEMCFIGCHDKCHYLLYRIDREN